MWADCYDTAAHVVNLGLGVTNAGDAGVPFLTVPILTTLLTTILTSSPSPTKSEELGWFSSTEERIEAGGQGWETYKKNAEGFAEECRLAGGARRACEIIEETYRREITEWDGPAVEELIDTKV